MVVVKQSATFHQKHCLQNWSSSLLFMEGCLRYYCKERYDRSRSNRDISEFRSLACVSVIKQIRDKAKP